MRSLFLVALLLSVPAGAQEPAPYVAPDYTLDANWLCRPDRNDACSGDIAVTSIAGNGKALRIASPAAKKLPPIDCFYVYPTVSVDQTGNSDLSIDPAETNVARVQFAAFRQVCRPFAPMYRQVTLKALRDILAGRASDTDRTMGFRDVAAAFQDYLARDNAGRGVVLVGHSQGSGVLKALLTNAIEGKPAARQIVAAYLPGHNVLVPVGKDVGGDLKSTPLCRSADQTGCVMTWVTFRDGKLPPPDARFGRSVAEGMEVACTNPAAVAGGRAPLRALLPAGTIVANAAPQKIWATGVMVKTPFVALPGLLSGECQAVDGANVLAVRTDANPADARTDSIGGDIVDAGVIDEGWGLHLIDVNVVLGDMIALAERQGKAWLSRP